MHELEPKEAPFQAPPVHHRVSTAGGLCLQIMSIYASQDIREIPREKAIAYTRALQHFAEQNNPPKRNEQCLLVREHHGTEEGNQILSIFH